MTEVVEDYLLRCQIRGLSPTTVKLYRDDLSPFCRFLKVHGVEQIGKVGRHHVEGLLRAAQERECSAHSVHRIYRNVKSFFRDVEHQYSGFVSPVAKMRPPQLPNLPPKSLTLDQIQRIVAACNAQARKGGRSGSAARRDSFFIRFLFDSGLRLTEALAVRLEHVDESTGAVLVRQGKGKQPRAFMVGQRTLLELRRHIRSLPKDAVLLFPGKGGMKMMRASGMRKRLSEIGAKVGFHVSPHKLRHSCARQMVLDGANIQTVQARLGHSTPQMSLHYAKLFSQDTLEEGKRFSPGDRL